MIKNLCYLLLLLPLTACDQTPTIFVDVVSETTVEDGGIVGESLNTTGFDNFASFDVSSSSEFKNSDAGKNNIGSSYVNGFVLNVKQPDGQTLEFIDEMRVFIGKDDDNMTEVAYIESGQDTDVTTLYLRTYDRRDIGQYLRAESTVVEVEVKGTPPEEDTVIEATMTFAINLHF